MKTFNIDVYCEYCERTSDAMTALAGKEAPKPGDFTICVYCATILVLKDSKWRLATNEDLIQFYQTDPESFKVLQMAHEIISQRVSPFSSEIGEIEWSDNHGPQGKA